jgi:uncharacterized membrane protein
VDVSDRRGREEDFSSRGATDHSRTHPPDEHRECLFMADNYIAYAATYDDADTAKDDFSTLRDAGLRDVTAALVIKSDSGRLHIHEKTHAGKVGATAGIIGGAVLGAIFPPAGVALVTDGAVGGASLGAIGHFAGGLSRADLKDLGALLEDGQAAVVAVGVDAVAEDVDSALSHAAKKASKAVDEGDVSAALADIESGVDDAVDVAAADVD